MSTERGDGRQVKSLKVVRPTPDTFEVVLVAPRLPRSSTADHLPEGLLEWLLDGKVLRAERIREARDRLARGYRPDAYEVAAAILYETGLATR